MTRWWGRGCSCDGFSLNRNVLRIACTSGSKTSLLAASLLTRITLPPRSARPTCSPPINKQKAVNKIDGIVALAMASLEEVRGANELPLVLMAV